MNLTSFRIWTEWEDGTGTIYTVAFSAPLTAASIDGAEREFKERMVREDYWQPRWERDFDLTGNANGQDDRIDIFWNGEARAVRWL
jgi:hypothetical protein